jgi:hypothetical protein
MCSSLASRDGCSSSAIERWSLVAGERQAEVVWAACRSRSAMRRYAGVQGKLRLRATGYASSCWVGPLSTKDDTPCPASRYVSSHVSDFRKNNKKRILLGYVSNAYLSCIRIGYVSDTRYAPSWEYPCNVGGGEAARSQQPI